MGDGTYEFYTKATDGAGNVEDAPTTPPDASITVDTIKPVSSVSDVLPTYETVSTFDVPYTASDTGGSGVQNVELYYRTYDGSAWSSWTKYTGTYTSSPISFTSPSDGHYQFDTIATDNAGNVGNDPSMPYGETIVDTTAPTGSIVINTGDTYTVDTLVSLTLTADSDVAWMSISDDNSNWYPYGAYSTSKTWIIAPGDGTHSVYMKFKDNAGWESIAYSDDIILDKTKPTSEVDTFSSPYTNAGSISISFTASDATSGIDDVHLWVKVSGAGSYSDAGAWTSGSSYSFADGDGTYEFYTIATDVAGNVEAAPSTADAAITLDTLVPTGSVSINSGNAYITSTGVTLTLSASDATSGVATMRLSNDGSSWSSWEPYATSTPWTLTTGDGAKTVYVQFKDKAGNPSASYPDDITLDTVAPSGSITSPSDVAIESSGSFTVSGSASDATSGVQKVDVSVDDGSYNAVISGTTSWSYSANGLTDGIHTFKIKVTDNAGWTYESPQISVTVDTVTPDTSASVTSGTSGSNGWYTSNAEVTIVPFDPTPSSGIASTSYSIDNSNWNSYTGPISLTEEGTTTIYYYSVDNAGNTQTTQQLTVKIDKTNPTLSKDLSGTMGTNNWYTTDVQVTLTGEDDVSGVALVEYNLNGAGWTTYTVPFTISAEGTNSLQHRVTDNAGQQYVLEEQTIKIDNSEPEVAITSPTNDEYLDVGTVDVTGTASDGAGVSKVEVDVDGNGYNSATDTSGDNDWSTWSFTTDSLTAGTHTITAKVTDMGGTTATTSIDVILGATSLTFTSTVWSGQYSDPVTVSAELIDLTTNEPIEGKTITFEIDTDTKLTATDATDSSGIAEVTITLDRSSGDYTITANFAGDTSYQESSDYHTFTINKETASIEYTGDSGEVTTSGSAITLRLAATLTQEADGSNGDLALATLEFTVEGDTVDEKKYSSSVHNIPVNAAGQAAAFIEDVPLGAYSIDVRIESGNSYWESDIDSNTIAVTPNDGEGYVTGGGWIPSEQSINGKINFAFVVHYDKKGNPKGSFVSVFKSTDGFNYKIKSTSWAKATLTFGTSSDDDPTACLTVTCVVQKIDRALGEVVNSWGNSMLTIDVTDGDYKINQNGRLDTIAITVVDNSSTVLFQWGSKTSQIGIGGGNIVVAVNSKKK